MRYFLWLALLLGGVVGCSHDTGSQSSSDPQAEASTDTEEREVWVETAQPRRGSVVDTLTLSGDLQTEDEVSLTSRTLGVVERVAILEGGEVMRGDLILKIEDDEPALDVREQQVALEDAEQRASISSVQLEEAKNTIEVRRVALERARKEYERIERILDGEFRNPLTQEEVDAKRFAFDEAKLNLAAAELARDRASRNKALDELQVDRVRVALDRAKLALSRTEIKSPIDGVISYLEIKPGELVTDGLEVVRLVGRSRLFTELRVPQRRLSAVRVGQRVAAVAESLPGEVFEGVIEVILPTVDPEQGTARVKVRLKDPESRLLPGVYMTCRIELARRDQALLLPKVARLFRGEESIAFVVRDNHAVRVSLEVGLQTTTELEVVEGSGILETDEVVVRGQNQLKDGVRVRVKTDDLDESQPKAS